MDDMVKVYKQLKFYYSLRAVSMLYTCNKGIMTSRSENSPTMLERTQTHSFLKCLPSRNAAT